MSDPKAHANLIPVSPIERRLIEKRLGIVDISRETGAGLPLILSVIHGGFPDPVLRGKIARLLDEREDVLFPPVDRAPASPRGDVAPELSGADWLRFAGIEPFVPGESGEMLARIGASSAALGAFEEHQRIERAQEAARDRVGLDHRSMVTLADHPDGRSYLFQRVRGQYHLPSGVSIVGQRDARRAIEAEGATLRRVVRDDPAVAESIAAVEVADFHRTYDAFRGAMKGYAEALVDWFDSEELRHEFLMKQAAGDDDAAPTVVDLARIDLREQLRRLRGAQLAGSRKVEPKAGGRGRAGWTPITRNVLAHDPSSLRNTTGHLIIAILPDERLFWARALDRRGILVPDGSRRLIVRDFLKQHLDAKRKAFLVQTPALTAAEFDQLEETAIEALEGFGRSGPGRRRPAPPEREARPERPSWAAFATAHGLGSTWRPVWFEE